MSSIRPIPKFQPRGDAGERGWRHIHQGRTNNDETPPCGQNSRHRQQTAESADATASGGRHGRGETAQAADDESHGRPRGGRRRYPSPLRDRSVRPDGAGRGPSALAKDAIRAVAPFIAPAVGAAHEPLGARRMDRRAPSAPKRHGPIRVIGAKVRACGRAVMAGLVPGLDPGLNPGVARNDDFGCLRRPSRGGGRPDFPGARRSYRASARDGRARRRRRRHGTRPPPVGRAMPPRRSRRETARS